jgi:hypothetical protein
MPKCDSCGKKGLFLKIEEDSGLCLACNEEFAKAGKVLTEKITKAKHGADVAKESDEIIKNCKDVAQYGNELVQLHEQYNLSPSRVLLDLIDTYKKMGENTAA